MKIKVLIISVILFLAARPVLAHCPLCTLGAGAAALGASWLGVGAMSVGVWLGAFALALGFWMAKILKQSPAVSRWSALLLWKKFFPFQDKIVIAFSFVSTILPLLPLMRDDGSIYISWAGDYGTLLNRTYVFNKFAVGAALGAAIMYFAPLISKKISKWRQKSLPYQSMIAIFSLLAAVSIIIEAYGKR